VFDPPGVVRDMGAKKKKQSKDERGAAAKTRRAAEAPEPVNELHEQYWSVVSFEGPVETDLTYAEAEQKLSQLSGKGTPGLCIVTNEAAQRFQTK